jgi:hypothetical protein
VAILTAHATATVERSSAKKNGRRTRWTLRVVVIHNGHGSA